MFNVVANIFLIKKLEFQFETGLGAAGLSAAESQGQAMEKPPGSATTLHLMAEKTA